MIATESVEVFDAGLKELQIFGERYGARGRFIALYLGFRLMGDTLAPLGSGQYTSTREIERFMDRMWTKTHRPRPTNVLTAPFGHGGPNGGYSTATGGFAPGNSSQTNTWRNNLNSQKGVGCVASPGEISELILNDDPRASCPHYLIEGTSAICAISKARYRGEAHSIWLGRYSEGFQVVDLDEPSAFEPYLRPDGARIPLFALLGVLYGFAPPGVYPPRREVTREEFEADFGLSREFTSVTFDCDPRSPGNSRTLSAASQRTSAVVPVPRKDHLTPPRPLPDLPEQIMLNSGVLAELAVASLLQQEGWSVYYTGDRRLLGYDLRAESATSTLHIEVKSSVGYVTPTLTESEWTAAVALGQSFVLALVDFVGSERQAIKFLRDPAGHVAAVENQSVTYRLPRKSLVELVTQAPPPTVEQEL